MNLLNEYRKRVIASARRGTFTGLFGLHSIWPLALGCVLFIAIDLWQNLADFERYALIALLTFPGLIWYFYVAYHQYVAFNRWLLRNIEKIARKRR